MEKYICYIEWQFFISLSFDWCVCFFSFMYIYQYMISETLFVILEHDHAPTILGSAFVCYNFRKSVCLLDI